MLETALGSMINGSSVGLLVMGGAVLGKIFVVNGIEISKENSIDAKKDTLSGLIYLVLGGLACISCYVLISYIASNTNSEVKYLAPISLASLLLGVVTATTGINYARNKKAGIYDPKDKPKESFLKSLTFLLFPLVGLIGYFAVTLVK